MPKRLVFEVADREFALGVPAVLSVDQVLILVAWAYCEATVGYVWGDREENPDAQRIREALIQAGDACLTRTEISAVFDGHRSSAEIDVAVAVLRRRLLADVEYEQTGGRPVERWRTREGESDEEDAT